MIRNIIERLLTPSAYLRTRRCLRRVARRVRWGSLRRLDPVSRVFGLDRGRAIDRYYIEKFIESNSVDIRGRVLEIGDAHYTKSFGGDNVSCSEVLHVTDENPNATLIGDLSTGDGVPQNAFDCIIMTQTLPFIYDVRAVVGNVYRALKPGGVVLATVSGISQISRYDMDRWGDYWRFTSLSGSRLFEEAFSPEDVSVQAWGNVFVATAFLQGVSADELKKEELDHIDPDYEVLIGIRAIKSRENQLQ